MNNEGSRGVRMGQFLEVGIAIKLIVSKKDKRWAKDYTIEQIQEELGKCINLALYDLEKEDEEYLYWQIKRNIFAENVGAFLAEQSLLWGGALPEELTALLATKDYDQIIEVAQDKSYCEFQMIDGIGQFNYLMEHVKVYGESIAFFIEGKAYLECYYNLFKYMNNLIRHATKNELKDAVVLSLS